MFHCTSDGDVWPICSSEFMKLLEFMHVLTEKYCWVSPPSPNTSDWWIIHLSQSYLPQLCGTEFSTHLAVAVGSSFLFCWGIFTSPESHSELGGRAVGQQVTIGICSSFHQILACCSQLTPNPHPPQGWGSGGQCPWQDSATTQGITIWALLQMPPFHSPFSPPTYCQIVENYQLSFSDSEKNLLF